MGTGSERAPRAHACVGLLELFGEGQRTAFVAWAERYAAEVRRSGVNPALRRRAMNAVNPKYVLRNHLAEQAIRQAEGGEFGEVEVVLELLRRPFDEQPERESYAERPPAWASELVVSCSS
jgi:uncharacterized protein YdiU (UPF0061 family)